ncbi:NACHT domain-containing protein [Brevundimonas intermedia]|uniref:NACHT domain-containing protein n=1 Tax=Brevundimonas intermedia TaxID=74315 RepID=A0A4Y9RX92_9CAUL|nr:NACHT domain-containing protein [Brevundimonas intermedia]TFW12386.1 NACHT domain-containing protein [Brevundimonas intermedia]
MQTDVDRTPNHFQSTPMTNLDANAVAIGVATHIYDSLAASAAARLKSSLTKVKAKLTSELGVYANAVLRRTLWVKTIVHPDESVHIDDIYVPLSYEISGDAATDTSIRSAFDAGGKLLIFGTAGGGKSMLIKKICSDLLRSNQARIPIFYELRYLNKLESKDLNSALLKSITEHAPSYTGEMLASSLKSGRFGLILDGFDEIDHDFRQKIGIQIEEIVNKYPGLPVIITSRPEDNLPGLGSFSTYHALRMSIDQTLSLISKIDYDDEKKSAFLDDVRSRLYAEHQDFMSIPLMVSMMLLTYSYYSEIPAKIHIFYRQAFDVLSQRHDRSKGVYTRKSYSGLSPDEFRDTFSYFCASTYLENRYEFGEGEASDHIEKSLLYFDFSAKAEDVKTDLVESSCLLQRDGINITFVHRSFQEYFTAVFISKLNDEQARMMIDPLVNRAESDSVLEMLLEMSPNFFERAWVLPTIDDLLSHVRAQNDQYDPFDAIPDIFDKISIGDDKVTAGNAETTKGNQAMALWMLYDIHRLADQWREPDEPFRALSAISKDKDVESEFLHLVGDSEMYLQFKRTGQATELHDDDPGSLVELEYASTSLRTALLAHKGIDREIRAWKKIKNDIEKRNRGQGASLASIISAAAN